MHSMKKKKGRHGWMVAKLNLEKAYDHNDWAFLSKCFGR